MKTFHKLLIIGLALVLALLLGLLLAVHQVHGAGRAAGLLSCAQGSRNEVLLAAVYAADLVNARQRNDSLVEQESIRLLNSTTARAGELLEQLRQSEGDELGASRDVREVMDLWDVSGDATEALISGRQASSNLEFLRGVSVRMAQRLSSLIAAAERERDTCARGIWWTLLWIVLTQAGLVALALWRLQADIFAAVDSTLEGMQLLGSGTLSAEATLPERGRGEFRELARHLNRFLERVRESDRTKDRFLAAMSHEIRTPMNGVIGFLGNLRETPLNEQQRQYVRVIDSSARSLLRVLNEILDFSKLEAGRLELEEVAFDLPRLAEDCVAMARQVVRGKPVRVILETIGLEAGVIRGDPTRLRQILDNLLGNAVKFTERGEIRLRLEAVARPEEQVEVRLAVSDTGIGISPDRRRELFQPFVQAEAGTTRKYGGTGLGLCIAARLAELMGGQLSADSRPGEGSTFRFTFVTRLARSEEQVQISGHYRIILPPGALRKFWALLVDDTPTNLFLMETICQSIGLPYRTATNGKEAVDLAQQQPFDLVFMDIQMPIMDGYTAIREIRKLDNSGRTQIIALTASAFQEDVDKALGAGSTGFLAKPFERDHLLLCIAQHLDVPVQRELREPLEVHDTREGILVRQMYDFMREQYEVSLGEIKMILAQSVADWRPLLDDLLVFSRRADWGEVRAIMHRLKGQLASIGLTPFAERADAFGAALRAGQTETLREEIETFTAELGAVFVAVEREVTLVATGAGRSTPPAA
jgi:signal transduction histidine kinase/CheY-like chemotaxis protein